MTEFFNVGYRATNRYGSETQLANRLGSYAIGVG